MSTEQNEAAVRRFYEEAINQKNLDAVTALLAPDFVHNGEPRGAEGQRQVVVAMLAAFPDLTTTIEALVARDDLVATRQSWQGTQRGDFMGVPASGRLISFTSMAFLRLVDGRIAQAWVNEDDLGLMRQLGALPPA